MKALGASTRTAPLRSSVGVTRTLIRSQLGTTGRASRTPLEALEADHAERPAPEGITVACRTIPPVIACWCGMVRRPLVFTVDALRSIGGFAHDIECWQQPPAVLRPRPPHVWPNHGLISGSEWTGVPLRVLLEEAGVDPSAQWMLAEGADAAAMSRSVPMAKAMDDAMLALFQNGERLRPENGYPVRLFLPGWEGNTCVKWLRRLKIVSAPIMTKDETSRYTDLQADGASLMFTYPMEVKSVITRPSHGMTLRGAGPSDLRHRVVGLGRSGRSVSTDGGRTWTGAPLVAPVLPRALTRFRLPWKWDGTAAVLKSRATDDTGAVQPEREKFIAEHGNNAIFHFHGIQAWGVAANGEVKHVYA
jgi:sulfane dehydrogenase subunit SoxC